MEAAPSESRALRSDPIQIDQVALVYNDRIPQASLVAQALFEVVRASGRQATLVSAWDEELPERIDDAQLALTFGGDGTILRAARISGPRGIPILGVNLGRLGFLTELAPSEAALRLPEFLQGNCWIEERLMLRLRIDDGGRARRGNASEHYALNDVVVGRGDRARVVVMNLSIDGAYVASIRADGLVIATPTGSTAYSLSAGGPIVQPQVPCMVVTPTLAHLSALRSMVIPDSANLRVEVHTDHSAMCSIDGQIDMPLDDGDVVSVCAADFPCKFLRSRPASFFYQTLVDRLKST